VKAAEPTLGRAAQAPAGAGSGGRLATRLQIAGLAAVLLAALGWWAYTGMKQSMHEIRAASLRALLDTEIAALDIWIDYNRAEAAQRAANPAVALPATGLATRVQAAKTAHDRDADTDDDRDALTRALGAMLPAVNAVAANVVDAQGNILATTVEGYQGLAVSRAVRDDLAVVFGGATRFIAPRPESERLVGASRYALTRPVVWFAAPVRDTEGRVIAALQLGKYSDMRFQGILGAARLDPTGESYAFDETGMMLTESRHADALKAQGIVPADAPRVALRFRLREPGPGNDRPLTMPVARAIASRGAPDPAARAGVLLDPYLNYVGRPSIGAYKWLGAHDIGVAVEVDAAAAYRPLDYLVNAFWVLFALLLAATAAAVRSSLSVVRLRRELRRLGQYRLQEPIGEGGSSTVYRAEHALLKRPTAVKVLKKHLATDEAIARFEREVRLASRLDHPATIEIYDYGRTPDGTFYYAMEYLDGITLAELVERDGAQPVGRVALILLQVCESLREAHGLGLVHRDIKPQNVMLCRRGGEADVVKVLDFGIAKELDAADTRDLTQHANVLGTPLYMAPERLRDPADADARADIYAVGVLAFVLLTGKRPFDAPYQPALIEAILGTPAPRLAETAPAAVPASLDALIGACLAKDRDARPPHVGLLIETFADVLREQPWTPADAAAWWRAFEGRRTPAAPTLRVTDGAQAPIR
jgi:serine/threonine-protein kinase